jgi:Zn-dependent peptidase ImmA (M78 family)
MKPQTIAAPALPHKRKDQIAELAEAVADEHCPTGKVSPELIIKSKGMTVSFGRYDSAFDGMLEHKAGRFHIYCNLDRVGNRASGRARFTLAHELGHFFIDEHRNALRAGRAPAHPSVCEYESKNPAELEADCFASNLLLPRSRFLNRARSAGVGLEAILGLAREFGTSITSAAIRYADLEVAPCLVIKWSKAGYSWKWLSTEVFRARYRKTIESKQAIVEGSPTWRALAEESVPECGFFQAGTTAAAWFPFLRHDDARSVLMIEQAIPLGRFGVLTFLYPEEGRFPAWLTQSDF